MYNPTTLKNVLFGSTPLIAWRQHEDPSQVVIDAELTVPTTGRYFQEAHPYCTLENIFSIAPRFEDYIYSTYSETADYLIDSIVNLGGVNYKNIQAYTIAGSGAQPPAASDSEYWKIYTVSNQKSKWLKEKTQGYILSVIDDFLDTKKWTRQAKGIIEERPLFDGAQSPFSLTENKAETVGFEFRVNRHSSVLAVLNKIALQFTETGAITINLYHSSQASAISTKTLTVTEVNTSKMFDLDWNLPYIATFDVGGTWTIEYDQALISGTSINKAKDWSNFPVNRQGYNYNSWKLWGPFLDIHPFTVETLDRNNPAKRKYTYSDNFGMNLIVTLKCDFTGLFTRQSDVFRNAILKGVAIKMLKEIAFNSNSRVNGKEGFSNISKDEILYEIDGNTQGRATGLGKEYQDSLEAALIDTEGIDSICLPCTRKRVRMRTT
jgi:hypothetical protein